MKTLIRSMILVTLIFAIFVARTAAAQYVEEFYDDEGRRWRCVDNGREVVCRLIAERRQRPPSKDSEDE